MPLRDVVAHRGHRRLVDLLRRSIGSSSLPPSLIFTGPPGVGKRATAIAVAQTLNCQSTVDYGADACGVCSTCVRIARGTYPDVALLEPGETGSIKIEPVREAIDAAAYRPFEGRRRVVIIDEADALIPAAQNALLKTLEEPPASSMFVLVTSRPDGLLATVRSRCPQLRFSPLSSLAEADDEARAAAERVLASVATAPDARRLESAKELLAGTGGGGAPDRQHLASELLAMASLLRDLELVAAGGSPDGLANPGAQPLLTRLLPAYRNGRARRAFGAVDQALVALDRNAGVKVVADWVVLQL